jgi:hypothetical protein
MVFNRTVPPRPAAATERIEFNEVHLHLDRQTRTQALSFSALRWITRIANGHGRHRTKAFAIADDHEDANSKNALDFWAAQERADFIEKGIEQQERAR